MHLLHCRYIHQVQCLLMIKFGTNSVDTDIAAQAKQLITSFKHRLQRLAANLSLLALIWHRWNERNSHVSLNSPCLHHPFAPPFVGTSAPDFYSFYLMMICGRYLVVFPPGGISLRLSGLLQSLLKFNPLHPLQTICWSTSILRGTLHTQLQHPVETT